ncbi:MAG: phosphate ABC transporter permease PstA [Alphaproteobacteria bacterium]|nr:phosphate ABC transporter permease PstA [Alphaproteobacteria bacterium SS10]
MTANIADTAYIRFVPTGVRHAVDRGPGSPSFTDGLKKRRAKERNLILAGQAAILIAVAMLMTLMVSIVSKGYSAFGQTELQLELYLEEGLIDPNGNRDPETILRANYQSIIRTSLRAIFPDVSGRTDRRLLNNIVSNAAQFELARMVVDNPDWIGTKRVISLPASDDIDQLMKGKIDASLPEDSRRVSDKEVAWIDTLREREQIGITFNTRLFTNADSRDPEVAGILGAVMGSLFALMICFMISFPLGVGAAIYLEEFAPKNKWTDIIEVNINNLAAVPSIIFGLLGLAVFLNTFGLPRSAPLVGGMVLALMTLPTIIIASRAALKSVPPSIREAALGLGASRHQVVWHHVLPLALPGMLTGTIIGMAQALGETAPLLMIGMVAFIADVPGSITDPATALPVQIYIWADSPERAFTERTSAAIMVLLTFLITMNAAAVWLRRKLERRW